MSVHDPEPKIPNDDNGRGLKMIGWFLLLWVGITFVWIPVQNRWTSWMTGVDLICFGTGIAFLIAGYYVAAKTPTQIEMNERSHDMMAATGSGQQNDEFATGHGPGRFPRSATR
jgi:hypothetical protein